MMAGLQSWTRFHPSPTKTLHILKLMMQLSAATSEEQQCDDVKLEEGAVEILVVH